MWYKPRGQASTPKVFLWVPNVTVFILHVLCNRNITVTYTLTKLVFFNLRLINNLPTTATNAYLPHSGPVEKSTSVQAVASFADGIAGITSWTACHFPINYTLISTMTSRVCLRIVCVIVLNVDKQWRLMQTLRQRRVLPITLSFVP